MCDQSKHLLIVGCLLDLVLSPLIVFVLGLVLDLLLDLSLD
jgi:hypothetical protein